MTPLRPRGLRRPAVRQAFYEGLGIEAFGLCPSGPWSREAKRNLAEARTLEK